MQFATPWLILQPFLAPRLVLRVVSILVLILQPVSTQLTYDWLCREHGPSYYQRKVLDGYGHLDTFMGSTAARDTYPVILEALEASA